MSKVEFLEPPPDASAGDEAAFNEPFFMALFISLLRGLLLRRAHRLNAHALSGK